MFKRLFRKIFRKRKKRECDRPRPNSFQEGMYSIYLTNYIKETDPRTYNKMVEAAKEEEKEEEDGRKGKMGYAKSVLFETMLWSPQGQKLLEDISGIYSIPKSIIPEFKKIAFKEGLIIDFDKFESDLNVMCCDDEGNIADPDGSVKRKKTRKDCFNNRKWIVNKLEKMNLEELVEVLEFINSRESIKNQKEA